MSLADQKCIPCKGGVPPLADDRAQALLKELGGDWRLNVAGHLESIFLFEDFKSALAFANRVGAIAEEEGHHPDLHVAWGKVGIEMWTHKIGGLTESDFFLCAKAEKAFRSLRA